MGVKTVCDIGCGDGQDLDVIKQHFPEADYYGIDFFEKNKNLLLKKGINLKTCNLETDELDFEDNCVDLFVVNQVYEHLKEIFWVSHEISKKLKIGGYLIIGIPNITALHNRILFNFGVQPSQMKSHSAHVRGYGADEIVKFFNTCFPGGYKIKAFAGSQFYPFPKSIARLLCRLFPKLSHSVFYLLKKNRSYHNEFIRYPVENKLETNFFTGR